MRIGLGTASGDIIPYRLREASLVVSDSEVSRYLDPILTQL